ncbi:FG-GAP-like repeat-containing protein [Polystyrenella longa]|nr:FG-GAP-like repeat-containing protein [Polystyrenella longa]
MTSNHWLAAFQSKCVSMRRRHNHSAPVHAGLENLEPRVLLSAVGQLLPQEISSEVVEGTDLCIDTTSTPQSVVEGEVIGYTITVINQGPTNVIDARVVDLFSGQVDAVTWSAQFTAGAAGTSSGIGEIDELVAIPVGGTITYTVGGRVGDDIGRFLKNEATVTVPGGVSETDPSNNSDYEIDSVTSPTAVSKAEFKEGSVISVAVPGSSGEYINDIAFGDLNNDGYNDAVLSLEFWDGVDYYGYHQIWFYDSASEGLVNSGQNLAYQSFQPHDAAAPEIGDFNTDGYLDVVVIVANVQAVYLNDGAGDFTASGIPIPGIGGLQSNEVEAGDLDGDGDLDLVVTDQRGSKTEYGGTGENYILLNDGTGNFSQVIPLPMQSEDDFTWDTTIGDFDGDGDLDFILSNLKAGVTSELWLNDGFVVFFKSSETFGDKSHWNVEKGDFDQDGDLDLLLNVGVNHVELWNNDGTGNFSYSGQRTYTSEGGQGGIEGLQVGDLDGDGDLDAFFSTFGTAPTIQTWINDGSGIFSVGVISSLYSTPPPYESGGWRSRLGDVDQDGDLDAFVFEGSTGKLHYFENINNTAAQVTYKTPETLISYSTQGQQRTGVAGQRSVASAADGRYVTTWWSDEGDGDGSGVFAQLYRADGSKVGGPFLVSTTTEGDQLHPSVAMQDNGKFVIVWQSNSDLGAGTNWDIHAQRYLASGLLDGSEVVINSELTSNQSLADVVYLTNGNFVATWTGNGSGDANGVFARIFDTSGNPLGTEFQVNETTTGAQVNPSLTSDSAGGFAVVWHGNGTGDSDGVFFRRYDNTGSPLTSEVLVNQTTTGIQQTASVTQANNGDFIVAWSGEGTGDSEGIFTRRLSPSGGVTGNEILVNQSTAGSQITPSITSDLTTNGYLVAWSHQNTGIDYDIKLRQFDGSDSATWDEQTVNQVLDNRQWNPTITQRPTSVGDQYVLAWSGHGDGDNAGVFTRALDASLIPVTSETLVSSSTKGQQRTGVVGQHAAAAADDGRYITTWWSDEGYGSGSGVFAQLYRADGSKVGGPFLVSTTTDQDQLNPSVAMLDNGKFVIVWQTDSDSGAGVNWEIHGQRFLASGLLDGTEFVINSETLSNQSLPDVAYLSDGSFVVTWTGKGSGDTNGVFARIFNASGNLAAPEFRVNVTTTGAQLDPSLTADSAGGFAVVWHGEGAGDTSGVFFRRFDNAGTALTGEVLVNETTTGAQESARVTQTATGDFIVTWSGEGTGDTVGIFTRRLTSAGALTGLEVLVNTETSANQVTPSVIADFIGGDYVVVWSHQNTGIDYDIKLRRFDENDIAISTTQVVNQVLDNRQWNPTVIQRPNSEGESFLVIWSGYGDGDSAGVFTRQLTFDEPISALALSSMSDAVFAEGLDEVLD